jgi:YD repeat-containing protein
MILFALGAVVREESGTLEGETETIRTRITHDGWTLRSFQNPDGVIAGSLAIFPEPTRTVTERRQNDGPMTVSEQLGWDGSAFTQTRSVTLPPGSSLSGWDSMGAPTAAKWRGTDVPEGSTASGMVERTRQATLEWKPTLPGLTLKSQGSRVEGSGYLAMRGVASVDLGQNLGLWRDSVTQRPDTRATLEGRDPIGRLSSTTTPDGVVTTFEYDTLGRLWRSTRLAKGVAGSVATWTEWDPSGRWVRQHAPGHNAATLSLKPVRCLCS